MRGATVGFGVGGGRKLHTGMCSEGHMMDELMTPCENCGEMTTYYDIVSYSGADGNSRQVCTRCFNVDAAHLSGLEHFEDIRFEPIDLKDSAGETHRFHFRARLHGSIVVLDAFELLDGHPSGYQCQVVGSPEQDLLGLLARLIQRLRRLLSIRHLVTEGTKTEIAEQTVRGRIDWDESAVERIPLLVIDGREISWSDFGRMLSAFEGWQFKLEIIDRSDEI